MYMYVTGRLYDNTYAFLRLHEMLINSLFSTLDGYVCLPSNECTCIYIKWLLT